MKALTYEAFQTPVSITNVEDPTPKDHGVIIQVKASGLCRSDWHGWMGHDADIKTFPHIPGHEMAGEVVAIGKNVTKWKKGDRVTAPFVCGCGSCLQCNEGNQQVCDVQTQPGFTHWGTFAEYVSIHHADLNLVSLPESMSYETAASLGCRFITSFRAIVHQGQVKGGDWVVVYGCGGVGLSAIMIANALGAQVIAVDIDDEKLAFAKKTGAHIGLNAKKDPDVPKTVKELTKGGTHVAVDALGSKTTCINAIQSLRKRGKHIQVGLLSGDDMNPPVPMHLLIANELEIIGSHGMQAFAYAPMLEMILQGKLNPEMLISNQIALPKATSFFTLNPTYLQAGITIINSF
ncbi:zinc-dependent alcohol dehydrogenase family protein [Leptobacterium sp. I13]|uniref:zinc-dependent alcohol dehydrogenase family protein n=1 Tax=Leptobacterium meishanense TaxID=3128904 RepID=UPI0030EC0C79